MPSKPATSSVMSLLPMAASGSRPRILLVRFGAMGDIIQTLPAAADLRRGLPDAEIVWAVDRRWWELLKDNPHVDELVSLPVRQWLNPRARADESVGKTLMKLRRKRFDLALDMQGLLKSAAVASACNAKTVAGLNHYLLREPHAALLYDRRIEASSAHVVDRYRELAQKTTGLQQTQGGLLYTPARPTEERLAGALRTNQSASWLGCQAMAAGALQRTRSKTLDREPCPARCRLRSGPRSLCSFDSRRRSRGSGADSSGDDFSTDRGNTTGNGCAGRRQRPTPHGRRIGVVRAWQYSAPTDPVRNGPYGSSIAVLRMAEAETTYKRSPDPSPSMQAWSAEAVYRKLVPLLNSVD